MKTGAERTIIPSKNAMNMDDATSAVIEKTNDGYINATLIGSEDGPSVILHRTAVNNLIQKPQNQDALVHEQIVRLTQI